MKKDLESLLAETLLPRELSLVSNSYDLVGDVAVVLVPELLQPKRDVVANAIMKVHKDVKTVLMQKGAVSGDFRLRQLKWIAGERKTVTRHREFSCVFDVDLERCYFSPRLSFERGRIAKLVKPREVVVNMFAGVGCFSIVMAKLSMVKRVFSIDVNPWAFLCMVKNVRLNRVVDRVVPVLGDAKKVVDERLRHVADRVLMPLPEKAYDYLDYALCALKPCGGRVHYYDFVYAGKGENPVEKVKSKVAAKLTGLDVVFDVSFGRVVRSTGPGWFQVVLDVFVEGSLRL